jgi:hypothetical protein
MFGRKNKGSRIANVIYIIFCVLLGIGLCAILVMSRREKIQEQEQLKALSVKDNVGIDDYEEVKERVEGQTEETEASEETPEEASGEEDSINEEAVAETAAEADAPAYATGISCWGDDLINGTASDTYSYMNVLAKLLTDNGYNLPVVNKTLQGGGTLSMMKMAGVADEDLQAYITEHQQAANGASLNVTETGIRDLTEDQLDRSDSQYLPVIFMGYYGGWNHDPNELAEQQERIINTFDDPSRFIVVGTRPLDGSVDAATLDTVLSEKWGEHYISLSSVTTEASATYGAQASMAQAILDKMEELGYISK